MKASDFLRATAKTALSIFLAFIALSFVGALIWAAVNYKTKEAAKQYEVVRDWKVDLSKDLQMQLKAKTKVIESKLLVSLEFDGYPDYLSAPTLAFAKKNARITTIFTDSDGFKLFEKAIPLPEMTSVISNGKRVGLAHQFDEFIDVEMYKRFATLQISWNFATEIPKVPAIDAPAIGAPAEGKLLDHCAPSLTKAERLRRLSQYGTVRETGGGEFSVGNRSVMFGYDGSVLICR